MYSNKFLLFMFSLIPGAGHMYIGLMKRGLSLMAAFFACIAATALFRGVFSTLFALMIPIAWFASFFDFWRYPRMNEEERQANMNDDFIFPGKRNFDLLNSSTMRKVRIVAGIVLIFAGLQSLYYSFFHQFIWNFITSDRLRELLWNIPSLFGAVAIIVVGLLLIFWKARQIKKEEVNRDEE